MAPQSGECGGPPHAPSPSLAFPTQPTRLLLCFCRCGLPCFISRRGECLPAATRPLRSLAAGCVCVAPPTLTPVATTAHFHDCQYLSALSSSSFVPSPCSSASLQNLAMPPKKKLAEVEAVTAVPPSLPPSVEEAYRRKCVQLKNRTNEVEDANDAARLRLARIRRQVEKLRIERAFLLEQLAKRTSTNVEDSEGSPSPPPTVRTSPAHPPLLALEAAALWPPFNPSAVSPFTRAPASRAAY